MVSLFLASAIGLTFSEIDTLIQNVKANKNLSQESKKEIIVEIKKVSPQNYIHEH
jgi:indole-3-glycerol phosphate synthase